MACNRVGERRAAGPPGQSTLTATASRKSSAAAAASVPTPTRPPRGEPAFPFLSVDILPSCRRMPRFPSSPRLRPPWGISTETAKPISSTREAPRPFCGDADGASGPSAEPGARDLLPAPHREVCGRGGGYLGLDERRRDLGQPGGGEHGCRADGRPDPSSGLATGNVDDDPASEIVALTGDGGLFVAEGGWTRPTGGRAFRPRPGNPCAGRPGQGRAG